MAKRKSRKNKLNLIGIGMKVFACIASVGAAVYVFRDKIKAMPVYKEKLKEPVEDLQEKIESKVDGSDKAVAIKDKLVEWKDKVTELLDKAINAIKDIIDLVKSKLSKKEEVETYAISVDDDFDDAFDNIDTNDREYVSLNITEGTVNDEVDEVSDESEETENAEDVVEESPAVEEVVEETSEESVQE